MADATNVVERKGVVYPFMKSATAGYMHGNYKEEEYSGICSQIAADCSGPWKHLETVNSYEGGKLQRKVEQMQRDALQKSAKAAKGALER